MGEIKVLHICTIFLTARAFIAPVARYLRARGYEVGIACSMEEAVDGPDLSRDQMLEGVPIHSISIPREIRPFQDLRAVWRLYRLIRRWRPDIVHTQTTKAGVVGRLAAWLAGTPVIMHTAHAFPFHSYLPRPVRWAYVAIERWASKWADLILVDTESVRADGLRHGVVHDPEKLVVVPMGVDLSKFSPVPEGSDNLRHTLGFRDCDLVVGTVARLVPDKGMECFLQMAARIRAARSDVRFLIVGDGPLRSALERLAGSLDIRPQTVFAGHRADVPGLMQVMDLFVLPTLREGFGVVFAEAMAMGKAVIGSRIGPVAEVVDEGVTGYLVPPDSPDEFAGKALELLRDEDKRRAFGRAGRQRVEKLFDVMRMCEVTEQHYRRLLAMKGIA